MTTSQRILFNALASYGRTMFAMLLGLFSSRWVLASLGSIDYGLMAVVGSLIVFISFLNGISSTACARFFALSIGRNDIEETNWWFNTALSIHVVLPIILIIIGFPIGEWAIDNFLSIPSDRLDTAHWVFRFSLVAMFFTMSSTPFLSMYTAKQNIVEVSIWGMATTLANFIFVFWLTSYQGDAWRLYSVITVAISILFSLIQVVRAKYLFPECSIDFQRWYNYKRIIEVFSYAGWTLLGGLGWMFYNQGISIVLNKFFPPIRYKSVNASYSVGGALAGYTKTLSNALMNAFLPEIVSLEGRGDRFGVSSQIFRASRLSFTIIAVFAIPLMVEADFVLTMWLKNPPEYAGLFCRTFLFCFLVSRLVGGFDSAICATGRIKWYQIIMSFFSILSVFVVALIICLDGGILGVCYIIITFEIINMIGSVVFCHKIVGLSVYSWLNMVLKKAIIALIISALVALIIELSITADFIWTHLLKCFLLFVSTGCICWFTLIEENERIQLLKLVGKIKRMFV